MGDIVKLQTGRGRPEALVPDKIAPARIKAASILVNPESTDQKRILLEVDGWLKELIQKSSPEGASLKTCILHALREVGYPITVDELHAMRGDDE